MPLQRPKDETASRLSRSTDPVVTRFAPSPTGYLHLGHVRSALEGWRAAREAGGRFVLRLDVGAALAHTGPLHVPEGDMRIAADPITLGDVVLARKELPTSYHLAVTVDDALQGVTLVTRGADLFLATHIHRLLQALLGAPTTHYRHHPLLMDAQGRRLAKRDGAPTIRAMRQAGMNPAELIAGCGNS